MSTKCYFCEKEAMSDTATLDPAICMDCAVIEQKALVARRVWTARQELNDALKELTQLKIQDVPRYIANVIVSSSGLVAVYDQFNQPMEEYQGRWETVHERLLPAVEAQDKKPLLHDSYNVGWMMR